MSRQKSSRVWVAIAILAVIAGFAFYAASKPMDFRVYYYGARGVFDGTRPVYGETSGLGWPMHYRYPPLFLLLFAPFTLPPLAWSAALWVTLKGVVLIVLLVSATGKGKWGRSPINRFLPVNIALNETSRTGKNRLIGLRPHFPFAATLFIAPYLIEEFRYGNAQFFVFALTAAGLFIARERPFLSGASLALAVSIKVWPLFFIPYLAARQDWKVVFSALCFVVVLTLLPAFYFGFQGNIDLLGQWFSQEFQTQFSESEIWFPNQSLRGVLMRYLTAVDYSRVPDSNYPQVHIATIDPGRVRAAWIALAAGLYCFFLFIGYRRREGNGRLDHGLAFCLVALIEPFTQKYVLAILLWPAIAAGAVVNKRPVRVLLYVATALALIQPLAPGANAQRLLQVLGLDFAATALLAGAVSYSMAEELHRQADRKG